MHIKGFFAGASIGKLIVFLLAISAGVGTATWIEQRGREVTAQLIQRVNGKLGRQLNYSSVRFLDWRTIELKDLRLEAKNPTQKPLLQARSIRVRVGPRFSSTFIEPTEVAISGAALRLGPELIEAGREISGSSKRSSLPSALAFSIPDLTLREVQLSFETPAGTPGDRWWIPFATLKRTDENELSGAIEMWENDEPARVLAMHGETRTGHLGITIESQEPISPEVAAAWLGRDLSFRGIRLERSGVSLRDVEIGVPSIQGPEVMAHLDRVALKNRSGGGLELEISRPRIRVERYPDGSHNISNTWPAELAAQLVTDNNSGSGDQKSSVPPKLAIRVRKGHLNLVDYGRGAVPFGLSLDHVDLRLQPRESGYDVKGTWNPGRGAGVLAISGRYEPSAKNLDLHVDTNALDLGLVGKQSTLDIRQGRADSNIQLRADKNSLQAVGTVRFDDVALNWPLLSRLPMEKVNLQADIDMIWDRAKHEIRIESFTAALGAIEVSAWGKVKDLGGRGRYDVTVMAGPIPCNDIVDSLPSGLIPELADLELTGHASLKFRMKGTSTDLESLTIEVEGEQRNFAIVSGGPDIRALSAPFVHRVTTREGKEREISVNPRVPGFAPYGKIASTLRHAIVASEDIGFFRHNGFDFQQIGASIVSNFEAGEIKRGGSTITQQLVKNLYLASEKTISRKLQEAFLTWQVEEGLSKQRILEIYLNIIEWGPDVYGVDQASQYYFGKRPSQLNTREAVFLAAILPNPKRLGKRKRGGLPLPYVRARINRILRRMRHLGLLDAAEIAKAGRSGPRLRVPGKPYKPAPAIQSKHAVLQAGAAAPKRRARRRTPRN